MADKAGTTPGEVVFDDGDWDEEEEEEAQLQKEIEDEMQRRAKIKPIVFNAKVVPGFRATPSIHTPSVFLPPKSSQAT